MNKKNIYFFIIFISFWTIIIILNFILPSEEFSENENRILAQMPKFKIEELITGKYVEKLNNYINDHFVFRNMWLKLKSTEERFLEKTENNNEISSSNSQESNVVGGIVGVGILGGAGYLVYKKRKNNNKQP